MNYRNGRIARNDDQVVKLRDDGTITSAGQVRGLLPDSGVSTVQIVPSHAMTVEAEVGDLLHVDDVAEVLREKGLVEK